MKIQGIILLISNAVGRLFGQPACSVVSGDMGVPSAGCLAVDNGELLLVKIMGALMDRPVAPLMLRVCPMRG